MVIEILPTVVPSAFSDVEATAASYSNFAGIIHVDLADGIFAPNTTWMPSESSRFDETKWEAHLMVAEPKELGLACIRAGASRVIGHVEAMGSGVQDTFDAWKKKDASEVGLGILFDTALETLDPYVSLCDVVQMMTIASIGVQGIPFEASAPERVAALHAKYPDLLISVDGGVSEKNIAELVHAGARRFCAGSVLSKSMDPLATYRSLMALAEKA